MIKLKLDLLLTILFSVLFVPFFIFIIFWLNTYASVLIGSLLIYFLIIFLKQRNNIELVEISRLNFLLLFLANCFIVYCCGIGGFTEQKFDLHLRSNLVWSHLISYDWPVVIPQNHSNYNHFSYYLGYFLPVSLIVKIFGLTKSIGIIEFFWVLLILQITTLVLFVKEKLNFKVLLILLPNGFYWLIDKFVFHHLVPLRFFSFFTNLAHGPQQVLSALILIVFFQWMKKNKDFTWMFFISALSFFWSPFVTLGIVLIYILPNITQSNIFTLLNFSSLFFGIIIILFYSDKQINYHFSVLSKNISWDRYMFFWLIDLVIFPLILWKNFTADKKRQIIYIIGILVLLSMVNFGKYNDLMTKVSVPVLLVYFLIIIQHIPNKKIWIYSSLILIFSLSSIKLCLNLPFKGNENYEVINSFKDKTFSDLVNDPEVNSQYYSNKNSIFNRYFLSK